MIHRFKMTFRDTDHFYKVVSWLNINVGRATANKKYWTISSKVLKELKRGEPVTVTVQVFKEDFDVDETSLFLNLT